MESVQLHSRGQTWNLNSKETAVATYTTRRLLAETLGLNFALFYLFES
jgi:hypothetical protein